MRTFRSKSISSFPRMKLELSVWQAGLCVLLRIAKGGCKANEWSIIQVLAFRPSQHTNLCYPPPSPMGGSILVCDLRCHLPCAFLRRVMKAIYVAGWPAVVRERYQRVPGFLVHQSGNGSPHTACRGVGMMGGPTRRVGPQ
ncbi:hypothetical protein DL93DRAFT_545581 [Clavulina sp. PMI_390]|nr:hypothetical protein DL93DRAFT_545581 [Clavulina sp. PMI_390]